MASPVPQDYLTSTVFDAVEAMTTEQKAALLLNTSLAMMQAGQCAQAMLLVMGMDGPTDSLQQVRRKG